MLANRGLGLAICRRLVELMGWRLWVESEPGQGSVFHFTVPMGWSREPVARPTAPAVRLRDVPVLVVDDNATNRELFQIGGAIAAGFGFLALLGWVLGLPFLASLGSDMIPMAPTLACRSAAERIAWAWPSTPRTRPAAELLGFTAAGTVGDGRSGTCRR